MERKPSATLATADTLSGQLDAHIAALDKIDCFSTRELLKENPFERTELVENSEGVLFVRKTLHCGSPAVSAVHAAHAAHTVHAASGADARQDAFPEKQSALFDPATTHPYERLVGCSIPHLPHIFQALRFGEDLLVYAEYIPGMDLRQYVYEYGLLNYREMLCVAGDIAAALEALHSFEGGAIIHRDVNPGNIVISASLPASPCQSLSHPSCQSPSRPPCQLTEMPEAYLIDLGIARTRNEKARTDTRIWGTAGYTAPEQFGFRQTDVRADEYSLAAAIGFMLTGKEGDELLKTDALDRLPFDVAAVLRRALSLDPENRYASVRDFYNALKRCAKKKSRPSAKQERKQKTPSPSVPESEEPVDRHEHERERSREREQLHEQPREHNREHNREREQSREHNREREQPRERSRERTKRILWRIWQIVVLAVAGVLALVVFFSFFVLEPLGLIPHENLTLLDASMVIACWFAVPAIILTNVGGLLDRIPWLTRWRHLKLAGILAVSLLVPPVASALIGAIFGA